MFANCGAYGGVRIWLRILSVILGILSVLVIIGLVHEFMKRANKSGSWDERWSGKLTRSVDEEAQTESNDVGFLLFFVGILGVPPMIIAIVGVELEVRWNRLSDLNGISSIGQVLPLVIECFSLFRGLALILINVWKEL